MSVFIQAINRVSQTMSLLTTAMRSIVRFIAMTVLVLAAILFTDFIEGKHYAPYTAHGVTIGSYSAENTSGYVQQFFEQSHHTIPSQNDDDSFFEDTSDEEDDYHNSYLSSAPFINNAFTQLLTTGVYSSSTSPIRGIPLYIMFHSWKHHISFV